jgi:nucleoside-diphosphate-sugar epimerase
MRVLLTGASGFLGGHVLGELQRLKIDTVLVGRRRASVPYGRFLEVDLLNAECTRKVVKSAKATHLIHLAWYVDHKDYWSSLQNLRWIEATVHLVEAFCELGGRKVIAAGTCAEYDWSESYFREDFSRLAPSSYYGIAKDATRRLLRVICEERAVSLVWGRIFQLYGPGEDRRRLIPSLFDVFLGKRQPFGVDTESYRDFVHVEDAASAFLYLLTREAHGEYNISTGRPTSVSCIVRIVANACKADPMLILALKNGIESSPNIVVGDSKKLDTLGWGCKHRIEQLRDWTGE